MLRRHRFGILVMAALMFLGILALWAGYRGYPGSDDRGSAGVAGLTGTPEEQVRPLVWQWVPQGAGTEAALFALQAGIGVAIIGWALWRWRGTGEREE
ncbi:MAG TPA: energy-coupling factor ABC transporter substrate-binding protein [Methanomicrobiales archaeon]|nr:energy-coupling factor ABC transporter substrate-binding protein [Methanomicrobiales archaeon]